MGLLGPFGCPFGMPFWGASWGPLGGLVGASWEPLRPRARRVPRLGTLLEPSWGPLGPSWGGLGGYMCRLGASGGRKGEFVKNVRFTKGIGPFLRPGTLLGRSFGASWGDLGASEAVWRPSSASLSGISATRGPLGPLRGCLGAPHRAPGGPDPPLMSSPRAGGTPPGPAGPPPPPNRPDRAPGGGVWGGGSISHADDPQGVGGFPLDSVSIFCSSRGLRA